MLSKEDKQEIAQIIKQTLSGKQNDAHKGMSKREVEREEQRKKTNERLNYLQELKYQRKDTLAQRMELEKLKQLQKVPNWMKSTAKVAGGAAAGIAGAGIGLAKNTINSRAGTSLRDALLYSNPITAILAMNSDLLKAGGKAIGSVGKIGLGLTGKAVGWGANGIYQLLRRGKKDNKNLPMISGDSTPLLGGSANNMIQQKRNAFSLGTKNYIIAQKVTLLGGKNQLALAGSGMFEQKRLMESAKDGISTTIGSVGEIGNKIGGLLPNKQKKDPDVIEMTKGINGIYEQSKKSNKILEMLGKKQLLIVGGVLIGVAAIAALAVWLKNKFGINRKPNIGTKPKINMSETQQKMKQADRLDNIKSALNLEEKTGEIKEVKKNPLGLSEDSPLLKPAPTSGYKFKAKQGQPYRAPFDLKVVRWHNNEKNPNSIDIEVERVSTKTHKNAVLMNVEDALVVPGDTAKRGEIIGKVPALGEVYIKDISKKEFSEYKDLIDEKANRSQEERDKEYEEVKNRLTKSQSDKISNAYGALKFKQFKEDIKHDDNYATIGEKEVKNYTKDTPYYGVSTEALQDIPMEIRADNRNAAQRFWDKNVRSKFANKNTEAAKQQQNKIDQQNKKGQATGGAAPVKKENPKSATINTSPGTIVAYGLDSAIDAMKASPQNVLTPYNC